MLGAVLLFLAATVLVKANADDLTRTVGLSSGVVYYVDQASGDDTNDGLDPGRAFQTAEQARDFLQPGDTLKIMGEYVNPSFDRTYEYAGDPSDPHLWHSEQTIRFSQIHGTESHPIVITAYNEDTVLRGDGGNIFAGTGSVVGEICGPAD